MPKNRELPNSRASPEGQPLKSTTRGFGSDSKRWLTLFRNSITFKLCNHNGPHRRQQIPIDLPYFGPNPRDLDYGMFGTLTIRSAEAMPAWAPLRRSGLDLPKFERVLLMMRIWTSPGGKDRFAGYQAGELYGGPGDPGSERPLS